MKDGRDEISETQSAVFAHVAQHQGEENVVVDLETDVEEGVFESLGPEDARLLFGVRFEGALPLFQTGHKVPEVGQLEATQCRDVKGQNHLSAHVQVGAALDVIVGQTGLQQFVQFEGVDRAMFVGQL